MSGKTKDSGVDCRDELRSKLTAMQYKCTQEKGTERAFTGEYYKNKEHGIYCCVVCKEKIFLSEAKYDSGSGWPAFYDIIDKKKIKLKQDLSHVGANLILLALKPSLVRTEVSCSSCGAHFGHVFDDGPKPTGKRFCVNSASLDFLPGEEKVEARSSVPQEEDRWMSCRASKKVEESRSKPLPLETSL